MAQKRDNKSDARPGRLPALPVRSHQRSGGAGSEPARSQGPLFLIDACDTASVVEVAPQCVIRMLQRSGSVW